MKYSSYYTLYSARRGYIIDIHRFVKVEALENTDVREIAITEYSSNLLRISNNIMSTRDLVDLSVRNANIDNK